MLGKSVLSPSLFHSHYCFHMLYMLSLGVFSREEDRKRHRKETLSPSNSWTHLLKINPLWVSYYLKSTSGGCWVLDGMGWNGMGQGFGFSLLLELGCGIWHCCSGSLGLFPCQERARLAEKNGQCMLQKELRPQKAGCQQSQKISKGLISICLCPSHGTGLPWLSSLSHPPNAVVSTCCLLCDIAESHPSP